MPQKKQLAGKVFGRLTVLRDVGRSKWGTVLWECQCQCGNITTVESGSLLSVATQSCGCLRRIDLTNQLFGRLTALRDVGQTKSGNVLWRCRCQCGNITTVAFSKLTSGHTKSCGCLQREVASLRTKIDLTGQQFGRLTVLRDVGRTKHRTVLWECQCQCGNITTVISIGLISGGTKSCGCWHREVAAKNGREKVRFSQSVKQFGYLMENPSDTIKRIKVS